MLIEYTIDVGCEPKKRFGCPGLWDRLGGLARLLRAESPSPEEGAAARQAEFELRPLAFHCSRCPANHPSRAFGCCGVIRGPISDYAEEWLADLLPDALKPRPAESDDPDLPEEGQVIAIRGLIARLRELSINGKPLDENHRKSGLLERRRGISRRYGILFRSATLSSSQVFQLLFCRDVVSPGDAELLCRALAVWEDGERGEDGVPQVIFTQPPEDEDDTSIAELKRFFLALIHACSLGAGVRLRVRGEEAAAPAPPDGRMEAAAPRHEPASSTRLAEATGTA